MDLAPLVLIAAGIAAIVVGIVQMRWPLATIRRLDRTQAELDRYDEWRGRSTSVEADGPTGADEMRAQMRQRLILWGIVAGAGVILILLGLFLR
jgi:hypothetical protein